jgi:hypothetical protein
MPLVRTGATEARLALAGRVAELRAHGLTHREVAGELGISRSYASELAVDPDGSDGRARKDGYGGRCVDCGARTSGADGRDSAPQRCNRCALANQSAEQHWTREAVLDAIRRFAAAHGRPPGAQEWVASDPVNGYPPRTAVYRAGKKSAAHFDKWADAIEAAGFPRPLQGRHHRAARNTVSHQQTVEGRKVQMRPYIVLEQQKDGTWLAHEGVESYSEQLAIEAYIASLADTNGHAAGRYVAIPVSRWIVRELQPVTSFKAVPVTA